MQEFSNLYYHWHEKSANNHYEVAGFWSLSDYCIIPVNVVSVLCVMRSIFNKCKYYQEIKQYVIFMIVSNSKTQT